MKIRLYTSKIILLHKLYGIKLMAQIKPICRSNKMPFILLLLISFSFTAFSQMPDSLAFMQLQQKVLQLQTDLRNQKNDFSNKIEMANDDIAKLRMEVENEKAAVAALAESLEIKIDDTRSNAEQQIFNVDKSLGKTTLWAIIGIVFAVIISCVGYFLLHKKQHSDKTDVIAQLSKTKQSIDEKIVNEFVKSTEVLETLAGVLNKTSPQTVELDHSLVLKVADEITLIERNISFMDSSIKGLKKIIRSVEKIKDNLSANGYDIPTLLGKPFNQGMKIVPVSTIPDDNLTEGEEIISKIIKPQVNYNGKMIQAAQIEVSVGTQ